MGGVGGDGAKGGGGDSRLSQARVGGGGGEGGGAGLEKLSHRADLAGSANQHCRVSPALNFGKSEQH